MTHFLQAFLLVLVLFSIYPAHAEVPRIWETNFLQAETIAQKTNRAILILFTGSDWSAESKRLKTEVLDSQEFQNFAKENLVLLHIDFPRGKKLPQSQLVHNQELRKKLRYYGGYPGTVLLNKDGQKLGQINGFRDLEIYLAILNDLLKNTPSFSSALQTKKITRESLTRIYDSTPPGWFTDFTQAKAKAAELNRPILALFTGSDWCGWCKKLKTDVLNTDDFTRFASQSLVLLYIDFPRDKSFPAEQRARNQALRKLLLQNSGGYPTTLLLDKTGKEIGRFSGYYKAYCEKIISLLQPLPPILKASRENDLETVLKQLAEGADVNVIDSSGNTPLHNAARLGNIDILRALLEKGARIDQKNHMEATPLLNICGSPATTTEHLDYLIAEGANLNAANRHGQTPLILSIIYSKADFIDHLLKKGADINQETLLGQTPIFYAVGHNNYTIVKLLLKNGADVTRSDRKGYTPLHHAAHNKYTGTGIVKLLLKAGADLNAQNAKGEIPFDLAVRKEIKELLRPAGK